VHESGCGIACPGCGYFFGFGDGGGGEERGVSFVGCVCFCCSFCLVRFLGVGLSILLHDFYLQSMTEKVFFSCSRALPLDGSPITSRAKKHGRLLKAR